MTRISFPLPNMKDFTVAICTYNGAARLTEVLEKLRSQIGTDDIRWEILIVDNNSNDGTQKVIQNYQAHWKAPGSIHYLFEPKQGVAFARQLAVQEAKSDLIGFLDDDSHPTPTWVMEAYTFGLAHPQAGAYGSCIRGLFDSQLPKNFQRIACHMVIMERKQALHFETSQQGCIAGAGMVVRRQAWLSSVSENPVCLGPVKENLAFNGAEIEVQAFLRRNGWQIWYNPEMVIDHPMLDWRSRRHYLLSYFQKVGLNRHRIRMMGYGTWQKPWMVLLYLISDLRKVLVHLIKYRKTLSTDLVATCEMMLFLNSFYSPFHIFQQTLLSKLKLWKPIQRLKQVAQPI